MNKDTQQKIVSIIIPTYNTQERNLFVTLTSVCKQTYASLEILVVDDGSDVPFSAVDTQLHDPRIRWISLPENVGVAAARNRGLSEASGVLLAFLDAGDWWEASKVEKQIKELEISGKAWVYCDCISHTPEGHVFTNHARHEGNVFRELLLHQVITGSCSSVLMKREVWEKVGGFYQQEDIHEDWDLWLRIAREYPVSFVREGLTHLIGYDDSCRSKQLDSFAKRKERFIAKYESELRKEGLLHDAWVRHYLLMGRKYFMQGVFRKGLVNWVRILRIKPMAFPFRWIPIVIMSLLYRPLFRKVVMWRAGRVQDSLDAPLKPK